MIHFKSVVFPTPFLPNIDNIDPKEYEIKYASSKDEPNSFFANPSQGEFFEKQYLVNGKVVGAALVGNLTRMQKLKDQILEAEVTK